MDGIGAAITKITDMIVGMIGLLRWVNQQSQLPKWAKDFITVLVIFGIQTMLMLLGFLLLSVVASATGVTRTMIGSALFLSRLRIIGKMAELGRKCVGNQTCRKLAGWLITNPDCMLESLTTAVSYGMFGAPNPLTGAGAGTALIDASFAAKECADRSPGAGGGWGVVDGSPNPKRGPPSAQELGEAGELLSGVPKNTQRIDSLTGTAKYRVPDGLDHSNKLISEVKNVGDLSYTNQIRDFDLYAQQMGYTFELWVRPTTRLSEPLQLAIDAARIVRRDLP